MLTGLIDDRAERAQVVSGSLRLLASLCPRSTRFLYEGKVSPETIYRVDNPVPGEAFAGVEQC